VKFASNFLSTFFPTIRFSFALLCRLTDHNPSEKVGHEALNYLAPLTFSPSVCFKPAVPDIVSASLILASDPS